MFKDKEAREMIETLRQAIVGGNDNGEVNFEEGKVYMYLDNLDEVSKKLSAIEDFLGISVRTGKANVTVNKK